MEPSKTCAVVMCYYPCDADSKWKTQALLHHLLGILLYPASVMAVALYWNRLLSSFHWSISHQLQELVTQNFCFEGARVQVWILWRSIYIYLILQSIVQKLRIRFRKNIFCQTSVVWSSHLRFQHISRNFQPPNGLIKVASEWPFNHNSCTMPRHGCWHRQRRLRRWRLRLQRRGSTTAGPGWRSWLGLTPQFGKDPFLTQTIPYPTHVMNGTYPLLLSRVCHILKCLPSQNMKESSQASSLPCV